MQGQKKRRKGNDGDVGPENVLTEDSWWHVSKFLGMKELVAMSRVCWRWYALAHTTFARGRVFELEVYGCTNDEAQILGFIVKAWYGVRWDISLVYSKALSDVSAIGSVHTLDLSGCKRVSDVSALGNVHTLYMCDCNEVRDVSALGGVHTMELCWSRGVSNVSALGHLHKLNLSRCENVNDVSALGGIHTLNLSFCTKVDDVSALGGVHNLNLMFCTGVNDVSKLGDFNL